jgi:hypothetical protein
MMDEKVNQEKELDRVMDLARNRFSEEDDVQRQQQQQYVYPQGNYKIILSVLLRFFAFITLVVLIYVIVDIYSPSFNVNDDDNDDHQRSSIIQCGNATSVCSGWKWENGFQIIFSTTQNIVVVISSDNQTYTYYDVDSDRVYDSYTNQTYILPEQHIVRRWMFTVRGMLMIYSDPYYNVIEITSHLPITIPTNTIMTNVVVFESDGRMNITGFEQSCKTRSIDDCTTQLWVMFGE